MENLFLSKPSLAVPKTNTVSERDFAQLDRLLREKPNAVILSLEALILFNNNQTSKWLDEKEPSVRADLLANARKCGIEFRKQYEVRKRRMLEERNEILRAKQAALARLQEKKVMEKEHLTQSMMVYAWPMADKETNYTGNCKMQVKYIEIKSIKSPA